MFSFQCLPLILTNMISLSRGCRTLLRHAQKNKKNPETSYYRSSLIKMSLCVVTVHNEISTGNHKTGVCESQSLVNVQATLLKDI